MGRRTYEKICEYKELKGLCERLERQISELPKGEIVTFVTDGEKMYYKEERNERWFKRTHIPIGELQRTVEAIEKRKGLTAYLMSAKKRMEQLKRFAWE